VTSSAPKPFARLAAAVLTALLAVAAASMALAVPASAGTVEDEGRLFELTNQARAQSGLAALAYDSGAVGVARGWAQELARSGNLRHNPNLAAQVDAYVTNQWTRLGENVGYASTPDEVHSAYMNSSGHRANILGDYNRVGVGAARDASGRLWTTVVFIKGPSLSTAPSGAFAPFASAQAFAGQQFVDVLGRPADSAGLASWTNALQGGSTSTAGMVASLVNSAEAGMVVEPVNRLYLAYFRRNPDAAGLQYWVWRLRGGATLGQVSAAFAGSPEFVGTYGSLSDQAFVDLVYRNVLGRGADAAGLTYWVGQLTTRRLDRGGVMIGFSESAEYKSKTWAWNDVVQVYLGLLRRSPDSAALSYWGGQLMAGAPLTNLVSTVLASAEYEARF
jgi:uncharacterized protein YkwD